jgi:hypothetical protein
MCDWFEYDPGRVFRSTEQLARLHSQHPERVQGVDHSYVRKTVSEGQGSQGSTNPVP